MTDEEWMPGSTKELINAVEREWKLLMDVVAKLEQAQKLETLDAGGWSPKDNLAHLTEWIHILMGYHMDKNPAHEVMHVSEELTKNWDMDKVNAALFERNHNRPTKDILDDLNKAYSAMIKKLETTPFEDLLKPRRPEDPEKRPLLLWVLGDSTEHFAEHRETIEKLL